MFNSKLCMFNSKLGTFNINLGTFNIKLGTFNIKLGTFNIKLGTSKKPLTMYGSNFGTKQETTVNQPGWEYNIEQYIM